MGSSDLKGLGKRLKALRRQKGLSQEALAGTRYSAAYISHLEAGKRHPSPGALRYLAQRLGVEQDQLLSGRPPQLEANLQLSLQEARFAIDAGDFEEAQTALHEVEQSAARHRLTRLKAKAEEMQGLVAERQDNEQEALEHYEAAEGLWREEPVHLRYQAVAGIARCTQALGDARLAIHVLESYLLELKRQELKDPVALMRINSGLIGAYFSASLMSKAVDAAEEAQRYGRQAEVPEEVACMSMNVARVLLYQGQGSDALQALHRAEEIFAAIGWKTELAKAYIAQGIVAAEKDDFRAARSSLRSAIDLLETLAAPNDQVRALQELARVERLSGKPDRAKKLLMRAIPLLERTDLLTRAMTYRELGLISADSEPNEAQKHLEAAVDLYRQARASNEAAGTLRQLGRLFRARGDLDASLRMYEEALDAIEERK